MSFDSNPPKGWYRDPELPDGERYWDGVAWTEARRSAAPQGPPSAPNFPPPPPTGAASYIPAPINVGSNYEASQASWALGLSIVGLFCCGLLSVVGVVLGIVELNAINAGKRDPAKKGLAIAAIAVGVVAVVAFFVLLAADISVYSATN